MTNLLDILLKEGREVFGTVSSEIVRLEAQFIQSLGNESLVSILVPSDDAWNRNPDLQAVARILLSEDTYGIDPKVLKSIRQMFIQCTIIPVHEPDFSYLVEETMYSDMVCAISGCDYRFYEMAHICNVDDMMWTDENCGGVVKTKSARDGSIFVLDNALFPKWLTDYVLELAQGNY